MPQGKIPEMIVVPTEKVRAERLKAKLEEFRTSDPACCEVKIIDTLFHEGWIDFEQMQEHVADSDRLLEAWKVVEGLCS